jgi:hypothetical protein
MKGVTNWHENVQMKPAQNSLCSWEFEKLLQRALECCLLHMGHISKWIAQPF